MALIVDHTQKFRSDYEDILDSRRNQSDLRWVAREWEEDSVYKYKKEMTNPEIFKKIKSSPRIQKLIEKDVAQGIPKKKALKSIDRMLQQMAHNFDLGTIRKFGLFLPKIMKTIYQKVYVNRNGIQKLKKVIPETPVIFLPTHRSYADFLLISYVAFHYNLPFPVIAAGMDFMSMAVIGDMLRGAGAFYIKRSFMNDETYIAVFKEYIQTVFCSSGHPVEFFLEGTRSRSGKSLPPKLGLLSYIVETWITSQVPDVCIVPISISYNRTLEEMLYAYELLGVPKPKESTSGLLKAMGILKENYGNIYFDIGDPISMNDFMAPRVQRHLVAAQPPHLVNVTKGDLEACEALSLHVLCQMQKNYITSVWSLCCHVLMRLLWHSCWSISYEQLLEQTIAVVRFAKILDARIEGLQSAEPLNEHLRRQLSLHCNVVCVDEEDVVHILPIQNGDQTSRTDNLNKDIFADSGTVRSSILHILLQHYVNQSLHIFIRPALLSYVLKSFGKQSTESLLRKYSVLTTIFSQEFMFEKDQLEQDFEKALNFLMTIGEATSNSQQFEPQTAGHFFDILKPFILCYQGAVCIAMQRQSWRTESEFLVCLQASLRQVAMSTSVFSCLSLDTCKHSLKALLRLGAITKSEAGLIPDMEKLRQLQEVLPVVDLGSENVKCLAML